MEDYSTLWKVTGKTIDGMMGVSITEEWTHMAGASVGSGPRETLSAPMIIAGKMKQLEGIQQEPILFSHEKKAK